MTTVVILAGGLATRLRPVTEKIPKALVEVDGEPFIAHQLRLLKKNGIQRVMMCVGYLGDQIMDCVGDGSDVGLQVSYSFDGEKLLGTAGAIKQALPLIDNNFFVLYGDSYLPCDYKKIMRHFLSSQKKALMTVFRNQGQWDNSNVEFENGVILQYDKINVTNRMQYIDYGLGVFNHHAFDHLLMGQAYDLAYLYQDLLAEDELAACEVKKRFYEVGSFTGIEELENFLSSERRHQLEKR